MKKLFPIMMACLLVASTSFAFETTIEGSYFVRGTVTDFSGDKGINATDKVDAVAQVLPGNAGTAEVPAKDLSTYNKAWYDQDLDIRVQINTDENTFVRFAIEARDGDIMGGQSDTDEAFHADYVYISHKFGTGTTLAVGTLNDPLQWGTYFGSFDDVDGFGLQVTQDMSFGSLMFLTQKIKETSVVDENNDQDVYAVGATINLADNMTLMPRVYYRNDNSVADDLDSEVRFDLSFAGTFDALAVEAEFIYSMNEADAGSGEIDTDLFGIYAKATYDFGFMSAGVLAAYSSTDEETAAGREEGFSMGGDFEPLAIVSNRIDGDFEDFEGVTLLALTAAVPVNDALTINAIAAYITDNYDTADFEGYEIDLGATYKITDALSYSVTAAYLDISDDTNAPGVDVDGFLVENRMTLTF